VKSSSGKGTPLKNGLSNELGLEAGRVVRGSFCSRRASNFGFFRDFRCGLVGNI